MAIIRLVLLLLVFMVCGNSQAGLWLPSMFGDHMVLQQNTNVALWGSDDEASQVTVETSWGESTQTRVNPHGRWNIRLKTPAAGGPHWIRINGSNTVTLNDVLMGEVWLASGQSNMEMPVAGFKNQPVNDSEATIQNSENNQIRLFSVLRSSSKHPLHSFNGTWQSATPSSVSKFSAVAYFFAKRLQETLNVPIGIVNASWSASSIEAWTDAGTLRRLKDINIDQAMSQASVQRQPSHLYNAMIHPFTGYTMQGVIWYQGEANRERPKQYGVLLPAMIASWRRTWGIGEFSFYYAQIAPFGYQRTNSALLREAQFLSMDAVNNSGMAVTLDVGDCNLIHPAEKRVVGERLARWALAKDYGNEVTAYSGPVYREVKFDKTHKATVYFDHADNGLEELKRKSHGFEIAGADKQFYQAHAMLTSSKTGVTVWSEDVPKPVAVRYAFENCPAGSLFNLEGLPGSSFRTDNWNK